MTTPLEEIVSGLREAAEKATPGPWYFGRTGDDQKMILGEDRYVASVQIHQTPRAAGMYAEPEREANAAYIARANPQALLSVLDSFQAQAARIAELTAERATQWHLRRDAEASRDLEKAIRAAAERDLAAAVEERDALKAEAIEALSPFAEASASYDPPEGDDNHMAWAHDFPIGALRRASVALAKLKGTAK